MTLLLLVVALGVGGPMLFSSIKRQGIEHRSLRLAWIGVLALCVAVPVLVVVGGGRAPTLTRVDVPLPLLVLLPIAWSIWLVLPHQRETTDGVG